ncbi:MAG: hypothetical protein R3E08_10455 [Thiotrichaceae bacterium]
MLDSGEYQQLRQELVTQQCVTQHPQEISKIPTTLRAFRFLWNM